MIRAIYFVGTNLAILVLLGIILSITGVESRSFTGLLVMVTVFEMRARGCELLLGP